MKKKAWSFVTALLGVCILFPGNWRGMAAEANDQVSGAIVIGTSNYTNNQTTVSATSTGDPAPSCVVELARSVDRHPRRFLLPVPMQRREHMVKDVVAHAPALRDRLVLVEPPMNAQVDPALPILLFSL